MAVTIIAMYLNHLGLNQKFESLIYTDLIPNTCPVTVMEIFLESATPGKKESTMVPDIPDTTEHKHVFRKHRTRQILDFILLTDFSKTVGAWEVFTGW